MKCPIIETIEKFCSKPKLLIIRLLSNESLNFNRLKNLSKLSSKTLSSNIKFLKKEKIVKYEKVGNKKVYFLTKKGKELALVIEKFGKWNLKWKKL